MSIHTTPSNYSSNSILILISTRCIGGFPMYANSTPTGY